MGWLPPAHALPDSGWGVNPNQECNLDWEWNLQSLGALVL